MVLKASIEIAINFDKIRSRQLMRQGYFRFALRLTENDEKSQLELDHQKDSQIACHPYDIIRREKTTIQKAKTKQACDDPMPESQIDSDSEYYHSPVLFVRCKDRDYPICETVCFKVYINADALDTIELKCQAVLYFTQDLKGKFSNVGNFEAVIKKVYNIGTFMPIIFDQFGGFQVLSSYHATVLEFKFENTNASETQNNKGFYVDFASYIQSITKQFNHSETRRFYNFYRNFIEQEYIRIQEREIFYKSISIKETNLTAPSNLTNITENSEKTEEGVNFSKHLIRLNYSPQLKDSNSQSSPTLRNKSKNSKKQLERIPSNTQLISLIDFTAKNSVTVDFCTRLTEELLYDFTAMKAYMYEKWSKYTKLILNRSEEITKHLGSIYQENVKQRFRNNIFSHCVKNHDWTFSRYDDSGRSHADCAIKQKMKGDNNKELWGQSFPIENNRFFGKDENSIKMFQEIYFVPEKSVSFSKEIKTTSEQHKRKDKSLLYHTCHIENLSSWAKQRSSIANCEVLNQKTPIRSQSKHLVILVHGFQASRTDFLLFKACLQIYYDVQVMLSFSNEGKTEESLQTLGKRLAVQVANYLITISNDYRISFIGHSIGGLIIRCALQYLKNLNSRLYSYISICTPHLGYLYQPSKLVQAGLWVLNTWQKCQSILQICMNDNQNPRQTFLYKLSQNQSLKHFQHVCFISSSQDEYVPYESARVQKNLKILTQLDNAQTAKLVCDMVDNILKDVKTCEISRIDVLFNIQQTLDSLIGRTGHVMFLSDTQFLKEFIMCFGNFFE